MIHVFAVLLALVTFSPQGAPMRTYTAHSSSSICAPQSICGWIRLGRTDTTPNSPFHNCVNVYENGSRRNGNGIGNPVLVFSTTLVGINGNYEIWGKWINPTSRSQTLGENQLFVACQP